MPLEPAGAAAGLRRGSPFVWIENHPTTASQPGKFQLKLFNGLRLFTAALLLLVVAGCVKKPVEPRDPTLVAPPAGPAGERYYYYALSRFFSNEGRLPDAIDLMDKVGQLDPESAYLQRELALLHLKNKDTGQASKSCAGRLQNIRRMWRC